MKSTEINDVMNNSPVNTLGVKIKQKNNNSKQNIQISNFNMQHCTLYETSNDVLFE